MIFSLVNNVVTGGPSHRLSSHIPWWTHYIISECLSRGPESSHPVPDLWIYLDANKRCFDFFNGPDGDVYDTIGPGVDLSSTSNGKTIKRVYYLVLTVCCENCEIVAVVTSLLSLLVDTTSGNEVLIMGSLGEKTTYQSSGTIRVKINTVFGKLVWENEQSLLVLMVNCWLEGNVLHYYRGDNETVSECGLRATCPTNHLRIHGLYQKSLNWFIFANSLYFQNRPLDSKPFRTSLMLKTNSPRRNETSSIKIDLLIISVNTLKGLCLQSSPLDEYRYWYRSKSSSFQNPFDCENKTKSDGNRFHQQSSVSHITCCPIWSFFMLFALRILSCLLPQNIISVNIYQRLECVCILNSLIVSPPIINTRLASALIYHKISIYRYFWNRLCRNQTNLRKKLCLIFISIYQWSAELMHKAGKLKNGIPACSVAKLEKFRNLLLKLKFCWLLIGRYCPSEM